MSRSFGDGSVAKWMMTTDQKTILADGKIGGTVAVGTVNLPTSARSAQAVYDAIREPGLSLATPVAGFAEGNAALVGLVGQKTAIPLTGMLTGGDSYRAGASDF